MRIFLQLALCLLLGLPSLAMQSKLPLMGVGGGGAAAGPTITRIQSTQCAGSVPVCTLLSTAAGNLIIVCSRYADSSYGTATATGTNTYTLVFTKFGAGGVEIWCHYAKNIAGGTEAVTGGLSGEVIRLFMVEYSGASTTAPIDTVVASASGTGTALASGSVACNSCGMIIGMGMMSGNPGITVGTGFSSDATNMQDTVSMMEDKAVTAATNATETAGGSVNWVMAGFTLK